MRIDVILPLAIRDTYTYSVPETMENPLPGMRVLVPLANRQLIGIVQGEHTDEIPDGIVLRDILMVLDPEPILMTDQLRLWQWMADYYMCPIGDVMAAALPSKAVDKHYTLCESSRRRVKLPEYKGEVEEAHPLDEQQQRALEELHAVWENRQVALLHGVTGSGKTEVYIHLIEEQLQAGRQVLYLVPEIALTTQLTDRLQRVFGNRLLVYHSRVSDAVRMESYRQLLLHDPEQNEARVIIGARSAIFLPLKHPGLIIVDEEHESSYKQQEPAPRYHARSCAIMLSEMANRKEDGAKCRVLLGTATPSVETYYNATTGKYGLVRMTERYKGLQLPRITMIDLQRQYHRKEMYGHFSDPLVARIGEELAKGKQVILFQNRRGYAPYMSCRACGHPPKCANCDVSLTVHMRLRQLTCHYCGYSIPIPSVCPECGGEMKIHGFGTERLEDEVQALFPSAKTLRMDLDTTRKKNDYQEIIDQFSRHECDILIGTQMVTKGLHFDDVSLVAVLGADHILNQPDFRSYERAFQMLEQVSGRAGRTGQQGEVVIQTFDPEHPIFGYLSQHNYEAMYSMQIAEREMFKYPPFHRLISITLRHTNIERLERSAQILQARLSAAFSQRCSAVIEPSVSRVQNLFIRQIRLRIEAEANFARARRIVREQIGLVSALAECKGIQIVPDVDPV